MGLAAGSAAVFGVALSAAFVSTSMGAGIVGSPGLGSSLGLGTTDTSTSLSVLKLMVLLGLRIAAKKAFIPSAVTGVKVISGLFTGAGVAALATGAGGGT